MSNFKLSGIIDLKDVKHIDPSQIFKVAVKRYCRVIQSVVVKLAEDDKVVKWSLEFDPGTDKPVGVTVTVGPDIPDERFISTEFRSVLVPAKAFKGKQAKAKLVVTDRLYRRWLGFCKTYTIRGRVVCRKLRWDRIEQQFVPCEAPVRGALVTAYDVDRLWWWCRADTVGSDHTDLNGNFEIKFRWCCWGWGPWYLKNWRLDPSVVQRIKEMFKLATPVIPLPPPAPELDLGVFETIVSEMDAVGSVLPVAETSFTSFQRFTDLGFHIAGRLPAAPDLRELRIWPWWPHLDCKPDIIFKVTQDCGEGDVVVYEDDCSDARWNIPTDLSGVTLIANANACCAPCCTQPPDDDCLEFQGVGCDNYPITQIEQDATSNLVGYGRPGTEDRPFGRTIRILGVFGNDSTVDFYKLQFRRYLPDTDTWTLWDDIDKEHLTAFNRLHWRETPPPLTRRQKVEAELVDGEWVLKTTRRFREEHADIDGDVDPFRDDWLTLWATARIHTNAAGNTIETPLILPDGLYELRVIGYDYNAAADTLVNQRVMPVCSSSGEPVNPAAHATMRLRIDNRDATSMPGTVHINTQEPESDYPNICAVVKNEGMADEECVSTCGVLRVENGDTITVHFQASDQDGHLERYTLNAHWAESDVFSLLGVGTKGADPDELFGPKYADTFLGGQGTHRSDDLDPSEPEHDRPFWFGGHFKVTVTVGDPVPGTSHHVFETCCAYLLRLKVWKRTTDGCTYSQHFHRNWSEFSFTIIRTDHPCSEGLLEETSADD